MSFSLRQLRYFTALAQTLHFGKAAEICFVTQSTLSAGIKELEDSLGARLAERTKRRVVLTPLGQEVFVRAQSVLRDAEDIKTLCASQRKTLSGRLRLGVIPTIAPYVLPHALPRIHRAFPALDIVLIEDQTERLLQALREGSIEVVLMALPWPSDEFISRRLFSDPFQLACPKNHRLATFKQVTSADFANEPLLLLADGHCLREHALSACAFKGHAGQRGLEGTSLLTIAQMVAGGLGVTLLPQMAIDAGLARLSDLALVPLEPDSNARDVGLVWRKTSGRDAEFEKLGAYFVPA